MSDINFRIKRLVDEISEGNNSDFAKKLGISEANVRNYIKETEPRIGVIEKICETFEVNSEWIIFGHGPMYRKDLVTEQKKESPYNELSVDDKLNFLFKQNEDLKDQLDDLALNMEISLAPILRHFKLKADENAGKLQGKTSIN